MRTTRTDGEWAILINQVKEAIDSGLIEPTYKAAADYLGINYRTVQSAFQVRGIRPGDLSNLAPLEEALQENTINERKTANTWEMNSNHPEIHTIDQLLDYCEVDRSIWMVDDGPILNSWPTTAKKREIDVKYTLHEDEKGNVKSLREGHVKSDGKLVSKTNLQIKVRLRRIVPVEVVPVIRPVTIGDGVKLPKPKPKKEGVLRTFFIADPHFGFARSVHNGKLTPIHDRRVLDIALQILEREQFDDITILGDALDLSEWSTRWVTTPEFYWTTQPTLIEANWWLRRYRNAQLKAIFDLLEGNHNRFKDAIIQRLMAAYELRAVDELALDPAISLPKLLALHELNINFIDGYKEGKAEKWFTDAIMATHSDMASGTPGATANKMANYTMFTTIFGHIHRRELISKKIETRSGAKVITSVCPGCACRVDAVVPGNKKRQQWQQGLMIMTYTMDDSAPPSFDMIEIYEGRAIYKGEMLVARDVDAEIEGYLRAEMGKIGN